MSALAWMQATGVGVGLTPEGGLELDGLERLDDALYARVLEVARARKAEIVADIKRTPSRVRGEDAPDPADASPLAALARFEKNPVGVVRWLAGQREGQPPHLVPRWAACIREEARLRTLEQDAC